MLVCGVFYLNMHTPRKDGIDLTVVNLADHLNQNLEPTWGQRSLSTCFLRAQPYHPFLCGWPPISNGRIRLEQG